MPGAVDLRQKKWDSMFDKLIAYKEKHEHCNVRWYIEQEKVKGTKPKRIKTKLAQWVQEQRRRYRVKTIDDTKIEKLESIGFQWKLRNYNPNHKLSQNRKQNLEEQFNNVVARVGLYVKEHGYGWIPTGYKEDKHLAGWAMRVRSHKKRGKLSQDRMMALEKTGFQWDYQGEDRVVVEEDVRVDALVATKNNATTDDYVCDCIGPDGDISSSSRRHSYCCCCCSSNVVYGNNVSATTRTEMGCHVRKDEIIRDETWSL